MITRGPHTYGNPIISSWGKTDCNLTIGDYCSISENVRFVLGGNHRSDWLTTYPLSSFLRGGDADGHPSNKGDIIVGNDVWLAYDVLVLSGSQIGDGCVIGAKAVIAGVIPPYSIVVGNPGRIIRKRFSDEQIEELLRIRWWDWPEAKVKEYIPLLESNNIQEFIERYYDNK